MCSLIRAVFVGFGWAGEAVFCFQGYCIHVWAYKYNWLQLTKDPIKKKNQDTIKKIHGPNSNFGKSRGSVQFNQGILNSENTFISYRNQFWQMRCQPKKNLKNPHTSTTVLVVIAAIIRKCITIQNFVAASPHCNIALLIIMKKKYQTCS